jgi:hypothetical protein
MCFSPKNPALWAVAKRVWMANGIFSQALRAIAKLALISLGIFSQPQRPRVTTMRLDDFRSLPLLSANDERWSKRERPRLVWPRAFDFLIAHGRDAHAAFSDRIR